jgi:hypothetical protein
VQKFASASSNLAVPSSPNDSDGAVLAVDTIDSKPGRRQSTRSWSKLPSKQLSKWFEEHIDFPYPNQAEREQLAKDCGLSLKQVNSKCKLSFNPIA